MSAILSRFGRLLRQKEFVALCVVVFLGDLVFGMFSPTFSLYATSLGASVMLVGALSSMMGVMRIVSSVPLGMVADAKGAKGVVAGGMLLLAASSYLSTVVGNPGLLLPIRGVTGIVLTAVFFIGMAYLGDIVAEGDRGLASGLYSTCMGLGSAVGSYLGGRLGSQLGYVTTYRLAAGICLIGLAIAWYGLSSSTRRPQGAASAGSALGRLAALVKRPPMLAASLGYLLIMLIAQAAVVSFFPLYADSLLISQAAIGSMFAIRSLASTVVRLPTGLLMTRLGSRTLLVGALVLGMVGVLGICWLRDPVLLTLLLVAEGICFGVYITAGQVFVTENSSEWERGTAMGFYGMGGSISSSLGPLLLGLAADWWGLQAVFWVTAALTFVGILALLVLTSRPSAAVAPTPD